MRIGRRIGKFKGVIAIPTPCRARQIHMRKREAELKREIDELMKRAGQTGQREDEKHAS